MRGFLVDANVILDLVLDDPQWADWSEETLNAYGQEDSLFINPIVYAEVSISFQRIEEMEAMLSLTGFQLLELAREALFLAGKAFMQYRRNRGTQTAVLPDFFIGAHAAVLGVELITRDVARYCSYFPSVSLISP